MKKILLSVLALALSTSAFANLEELFHDHDRGHRRGHHHAGACAKVKATAEQKAELKELMTKHRQSAKQMRKDLMAAHKEYNKLLANSRATRDQAQAATDTIAEKGDALRLAQLNLRTSILFDVFEADQRKAAMKCMQQMRRRMQRQPRHPRRPQPRRPMPRRPRPHFQLDLVETL